MRELIQSCHMMNTIVIGLCLAIFLITGFKTMSISKTDERLAQLRVRCEDLVADITQFVVERKFAGPEMLIIDSETDSEVMY